MDKPMHVRMVREKEDEGRAAGKKGTR